MGRDCAVRTLSNAETLLNSAAVLAIGESGKNPWPSALLQLTPSMPCMPAMSCECPASSSSAADRPTRGAPCASSAAAAAATSSSSCPCSNGESEGCRWRTTGHDLCFAIVLRCDAGVPMRTYGASLLGAGVIYPPAVATPCTLRADVARLSLLDDDADRGTGVRLRDSGDVVVTLQGCRCLAVHAGSTGKDDVPLLWAASAVLVSNTTLLRFTGPLKRRSACRLRRAAGDGGETHDRAVALLCFHRKRSRAACTMLRTLSRTRCFGLGVSAAAVSVSASELTGLEAARLRRANEVICCAGLYNQAAAGLRGRVYRACRKMRFVAQGARCLPRLQGAPSLKLRTAVQPASRMRRHR